MLSLQGAGDGASWWVGGSVVIKGAAGAVARLDHAGNYISTVTVGSDDRAVFFSNKPIIPIGYANYGSWLIRVDRAGLVGMATAELGDGPILHCDRPEFDRHAGRGGRVIVCTVPVSVVSQTWVPTRLSKRSQLLEANNELLLTDDADMFLRWGR